METPLPIASGLRVERSHKIPVRTFCGMTGPLRGSHAPIHSERAIVSGVSLHIPASGLLPIGWEARTLLATASSPAAGDEALERTLGQ